MRLVLKFTSALLAGILAVISCYGYLRVRREIRFFESDIKRDHRILARAITPGIEDVWRNRGEQDALNFVDAVNEREPRLQIRWVWLDEAAPAEHRSLAPITALAAGSAFDAKPIQLTVSRDDGSRFVTTYRSIRTLDGRLGAVEISENLEEERTYVRMTIIRMASSVVFIVFVCGIIAFALGYSFVAKPIQRLVDLTRRVGEGDFSAKIDLQQHDEIGTLGREMNHMAERLAEARRRVVEEQQARIAALDQLRHADRLASLGSLTAGVAHELGTPLNVVLGRANLLVSREIDSGGVHDNARIIAEQSRRMIESIRQLLGFARRRGGNEKETRIAAAVDDVVKLLTPLAAHSGVVLEVDEAMTDPQVALSSQHLQQVLFNLVVNAIQASSSSQHIHIHWGISPGGSAAFIRVRDHGTGIPPENLGKIFEPFFTTKGPGEGTGLGLSVVSGIVREHGGTVVVESVVGAGSTFTVHLPSEQSA